MGKGKAKLWVALIVVIGVIGFLIYDTMNRTQVYYMKPSEMLRTSQSAPSDVFGKRIRVGGLIVADSISGRASHNKLTFKVTDERGKFQTQLVMVSTAQTKKNDTVSVDYKGIVPDTFKAGGFAYVEGRYEKNGTFVADTLLAKCPSKYEGAAKKASK